MVKKTIGVVVSFAFLSILLSQISDYRPGFGPVPHDGSNVVSSDETGAAVPFISTAHAQGGPGGGNPTADAGIDRSAAVGTTVTLDGSRSTTASTQVLDYAWTITDRPVGSSAALDDATALKPSFTADIAGNYVIELVVTAGSKSSSPDTVTISTTNSPPRADAGRDRNVALSATVALDGAGSWDDDGDSLTYSWTLITRPGGSTAAISDTTAVRPTITIDVAGDYLAELVVNDGTVSSDSVQVTLSTSNVAPVAHAGYDDIVTVGQDYDMDGDLSNDGNGDTLDWDWKMTARPSASGSKPTPPNKDRPTLTISHAGTYVAQLNIDDPSTNSRLDTVILTTGDVNLAPLANAGPDQGVTVSSVVTLDGAASTDREGDPLSYQWALLVVPSGSAAALDDIASVRPGFTADVAGTYVAQLKVYDGTEWSIADTVAIDTVNAAPTADAGSDQTVSTGNLVQLDGTGSSDPDNDPLTYRWALLQVAKNSNASLSDPTAVSPTFTADKAGTYVLQLLVSDGTHESYSDNVTITTENSRPEADAGSEQSVDTNDLVQLDGTGSSDADNDPLTYSWSLLSKPAGSTATLSNPAIANPTFTADQIGFYVAQLIVQDATFASFPSTVVIEAVNAKPIADAGPDQNVTAGATVQLDGSNSTDPEEQPLTYAWSFVSTPAGSNAQLSDPTAESPTFVADRVGMFVVQLIVNDGFQDSDPDTVSITSSNSLPTANAGPNQNVVAGTTVDLDGTGSSDPDGHNLSYAWTIVAKPAGSNATLPNPASPTPSFIADAVGTFTIELVVSDPFASSSADSVTITSTNNAPTANAGPDQNVDVDDQVTLNGAGSSDGDGGVQGLSYSWSLNTIPAGSLGLLSGTTEASATLVPDVAGTYIIDLIVNDGFASSVFDSVTVTAAALPVNLPPTLDPVGNQTVALGATLMLTLTASDPELDPITFSAAPVPLPAGASLDGNTGLFTFKPDETQIGVLNLTFSASDGMSSDSEAISVTVTQAPAGSPTELTGRLLDANSYAASQTEVPIDGATVSLLGSGISTTSDINGNFTLTGIPSGTQTIAIDASTALPSPDPTNPRYANFREPIEIIAEVTNEVTRPIFLPRIDETGVTAALNVGADTMVMNTTLGIEMLVLADTAMDENGQPYYGEVSISEVPENQTPVALPDTLNPSMLITIQPAGMTFTQPAPITFPNTDNLPVGAEIDIWSVNPVSGQFEIVGTGIVVDLGGGATEIQTLTGGITAATWSAPLSPPAAAEAGVGSGDGDSGGNNPENQSASNEEGNECGSRACIASGCLTVAHSTASYRIRNQDRSLRFVYYSLSADPRPIIRLGATVVQRSAVPETMSSKLSIAGVQQGAELYTGTQGNLNDNQDETVRQAIQIDGSSLPTGIYPYEQTITNNFQNSSVGIRVQGQVLIRNERDSPFGAGWDLAGLHRINEMADGTVVLTTGDGSILRFDPATGGDGTFQGPSDYTTINFPTAIAVADFNEDGNIDVAVPDRSSDQIFILVGDGTGALSLHTSFPARPGGGNSDPLAVDVGDFNNDDNLDLSIANLNGPIVAALGDGSGNFTTVQAGPGDRFTARVGDFDNDGNDDILSAGFKSNLINDEVRILYGDGTGNFPDEWAGSLPDQQSEPHSVVVHDFNSDGLDDFAFALSNDIAPGGTGDEVRVYIMQPGIRDVPAPTILEAQDLRVLVGVWSIDVGDFDNSGTTDIAVANYHSNTISVFLSLTDGTFTSGDTGVVVPLEPLVKATGLAVGDFNGDGNDDLVTTDEGAPGQSRSIIFGNGDGTFQAAMGLNNAGLNTVGRAVRVADLNNDTALDLVYSADVRNTISVFVGNLSGGGGGGNYASPPGDFSTLVKNPDDTFTRTTKHGTVFQFDTQGRQVSVTDRNGNPINYVYDAQGRLETITDPVGKVTTLAYPSGQVTITDPASRVTTFDLDADNNLRKITDPDGSTRLFNYDDQHRLTTKVTKRGHVFNYVWNHAGRVSQINRPDGTSATYAAVESVGLPDIASGEGTSGNPAPVKRPDDADIVSTSTDPAGNLYEYDTDRFGAAIRRKDPTLIPRETFVTRNSDGLPTRITDARGLVTDMAYDGIGNLLTQSDAVGQTGYERTTTFEYEPSFSLVSKIIDPNLKETLHTYDANGNLDASTDVHLTVTDLDYTDVNCPGLPTQIVRAMGLPEESTTTFTYDPTSCNLDAATNGEGDITKYTYNQAGYTLTITKGFGSPDERMKTFSYDDLNRTTSAVEGDGGVLSISYDADGNVAEIVSPTGEVESRTYDFMNRLSSVSDPISGLTLYEYDLNGNLAKVTDSQSNVTRMVYDAVNRMVKRLDATNTTPDPANANCGDPGVACFTYDDNDNLLTVQDERGKTTSYQYDPRDRLERRTNPLSEFVTFTYDSRDNLDITVDFKGQTIDRDYDDLSNLTSVTTPDNTTTLGYDALSRLISANDNDSTLSFTYDLADRLKTVETAAPGIQPLVTLTNVYDDAGDRRQLLDSEGGTTLFDYDLAGRLKKLTTPASGIVDITHDLAGRPTNVTRPNGVQTSFAFDLQGRMEQLTDGPFGLELENFNYQFGAVGNITEITDLFETRNFTYDALHRLTSAGTTTAPESYSYDELGNRVTSHLSASHVVDDANRLTQDDNACYLYDLNGNLEIEREKVGGVCTPGVAETVHAYDAQNQLVQITFPDTSTTTYKYDALGRRIEKEVDGTITTYVYDGPDILLEFDGADNLIARYGHGDRTDQPLTMARDLDASGTFDAGESFYYHADHQGSVVFLTDETGNVANEYTYDAYGQPVTLVESVTNPYLFTAREYDPESGLYHYRARVYDAETGRFLQEDLIHFASGDFNLFRYVENNPVNWNDPSGLTKDGPIIDFPPPKPNPEEWIEETEEAPKLPLPDVIIPSCEFLLERCAAKCPRDRSKECPSETPGERFKRKAWAVLCATEYAACRIGKALSGDVD